MKSSLKFAVFATLAAFSTLACFAAETVVIESRKADSTLNTPTWTEVSGKWKPSKNKSRVAADSFFLATNVSICATNLPLPAFKVLPTGLEADTTYTVEVTFCTRKTQMASLDLVVAVSTDGISASTIPTNTQK